MKAVVFSPHSLLREAERHRRVVTGALGGAEEGGRAQWATEPRPKGPLQHPESTHSRGSDERRWGHCRMAPGGQPSGDVGGRSEVVCGLTAPPCELSAEKKQGSEPSCGGWGREAPRGGDAGKLARLLTHAWGDRNSRGGKIIYLHPQPAGNRSVSSDSDPRHSGAVSRLPTCAHGGLWPRRRGGRARPGVRPVCPTVPGPVFWPSWEPTGTHSSRP